MPSVLAGIECFSLYKYQLKSLDFVINMMFMKLLKTTDMQTVLLLQEIFGFTLPSVQIYRRRMKFLRKNSCFIIVATNDLMNKDLYIHIYNIQMR